MISLNLILGPFKEPFLKASLDSAFELCSEFVIVDTAPGNNPNMDTIQEWILSKTWDLPDEAFVLLEMPRGEDKDFSFAAARDLARMNSSNKWCLRLDADEVLHENDIPFLRRVIRITDAPAVEVSFYHHMVYPCLYQYIEPKTILFQRDKVHWKCGVHEILDVTSPLYRLYAVKFHHYGYCRGQAEVLKRWQLYVDIDGKPDWYKGRDPNNILTDRLSVCATFEGTHPKYVMPTLLEMFDASEI